jgi:hypothetical protein
VPTPPQPWRRFRHADGRGWQLRLAGHDVEIFIEVDDDEPIERRRSFATREAAQRDHEALIREQLADGFIEQPGGAANPSAL